MPTLHNELSVVLGDTVHVVEVFDDRWAYMEKKSGSKPEKGLISIDCLWESGQDVPAFWQRGGSAATMEAQWGWRYEDRSKNTLWCYNHYGTTFLSLVTATTR
jgi:hypothetical protein